MLKLYSYFRSSASYRARIALHWKGLPFEYIPVHLTREGGQQNKPEYLAINPMGHVPALIHGDFLIAETMAILQYLDDVFPARALFPAIPRDRAQVMQICELINSGIQPLQNLKVTKSLEVDFGMSKSGATDFTRFWIADGMHKLEKLLERTAGSFCFGGEVTAADCFLIPQCFSARRFGVDTSQFANISFIEANCVKLVEFARAHPEKQPDYQA